MRRAMDCKHWENRSKVHAFLKKKLVVEYISSIKMKRGRQDLLGAEIARKPAGY